MSQGSGSPNTEQVCCRTETITSIKETKIVNLKKIPPKICKRESPVRQERVSQCMELQLRQVYRTFHINSTHRDMPGLRGSGRALGTKPLWRTSNLEAGAPGVALAPGDGDWAAQVASATPCIT